MSIPVFVTHSPEEQIMPALAIATPTKTARNPKSPQLTAARQHIRRAWDSEEAARRRELGALMLRRLGEVLGVAKS